MNIQTQKKANKAPPPQPTELAPQSPVRMASPVVLAPQSPPQEYGQFMSETNRRAQSAECFKVQVIRPDINTRGIQSIHYYPSKPQPGVEASSVIHVGPPPIELVATSMIPETDHNRAADAGASYGAQCELTQRALPGSVGREITKRAGSQVHSTGSAASYAGMQFCMINILSRGTTGTKKHPSPFGMSWANWQRTCGDMVTPHACVPWICYNSQWTKNQKDCPSAAWSDAMKHVDNSTVLQNIMYQRRGRPHADFRSTAISWKQQWLAWILTDIESYTQLTAVTMDKYTNLPIQFKIVCGLITKCAEIDSEQCDRKTHTNRAQETTSTTPSVNATGGTGTIT